jgi:hypothetical protein
MKRRFLLHSLSHTFLVVDITDISLLGETDVKRGQQRAVPALLFSSWKEAARYFAAAGASLELVESTSSQVRRAGVAVLTIP